MRISLTKPLAAIAAVVGLTTVAVALAQDAAPAPAPETPEGRAIAGRLGEFGKAYEAGDAAALAALYADEAVIVTPEGEEIRGKEAIGRMYAESFAEGSGLKLETHVDATTMITPDVARVEGRSRVAATGGDAADYLRFSALIVRKGDVWSIAELRERPAPSEDVAPRERLRDLEWMVGEWVDEGDRHKVTAEIKWADNHSYLIRTHSAELDGRPRASATMFIGWDPQTGQIKSWLFDSEGGRGEGTWTRAGEDQWIIKTTGVTRDGLPSSSTQIQTVLNKDSVRTDSVDRVIGGRIEEDVVDLIMVRKPPAPAAAAPAAK